MQYYELMNACLCTCMSVCDFPLNASNFYQIFFTEYRLKCIDFKVIAIEFVWIFHRNVNVFFSKISTKILWYFVTSAHNLKWIIRSIHSWRAWSTTTRRTSTPTSSPLSTPTWRTRSSTPSSSSPNRLQLPDFALGSSTLSGKASPNSKISRSNPKHEIQKLKNSNHL